MGRSGPPHWNGMFDLGRMARRAGASFYENRVAFRKDYGHDFDCWADDRRALQAGWLHEDAGRDEAMQTLLRLRTW